MIGVPEASILIGVLIVAGRGPMIFAPAATLRAYRSLLATDARIRGFGAVALLLGAVLASIALHPDGTLAWIVAGFGWLLVVVSVSLVLVPRFYRELAQSVLDAFDDPAAVRVVGTIAVALGLLLIAAGVRAL